MEETAVPQIYVVNRTADYPAIHRALSIHPICACLISSVLDYELALSFSESVSILTSEDAAMEFAKALSEQESRPVLVIGSADRLDAVYANGKREAVNA